MKAPLSRPFALLAGAALLLLAGTGCQTISQRQYGRYLGDPVMRSDHDSAGIALSEHLFFSREAATGGRGVGGGGCGCN